MTDIKDAHTIRHMTTPSILFPCRHSRELAKFQQLSNLVSTPLIVINCSGYGSSLSVNRD